MQLSYLAAMILNNPCIAEKNDNNLDKILYKSKFSDITSNIPPK